MLLRGYPLALWAAAACAGYGLTLSRFLGIEGNLGDAGVLGLLCLAIVGCALHFVVALSPAVQLGVLGAGTALLVLFRSELRRRAAASPIALLAGASAFFHKQAITLLDNGLYHLQTVEWNSQFPITPGLGNLHGRLAFNSSLFLMAPLDDRLAMGWISNLLLLMFVLMSCGARTSQVRRNRAEFWFLCLTVATLAILPQTFRLLGVLNADAFSAVLIVYWFAAALSASADAQSNASLLVLTAAFACTVKISAAPLLLFAAAAAWIWRKTPEVRLGRAVAVGVLFLAMWGARGVALSGCAVYPAAPTCVFSLPWAVSSQQVASEALSTRAWGRNPGRFDYQVVMAGWAWLPSWIARSLASPAVRFFLAGLAGGILAAMGGARFGRLWKGVAGALAVGVLYWFVTVPDPRFGAGFLVAVGIAGVSAVCAAWLPEPVFLRRLTTEVAVAAILIGLPGFFEDGTTWSATENPIYDLKSAPGEKPIWVPRAPYLTCWDHAVPCSPYFRPSDLQRVRWRSP